MIARLLLFSNEPKHNKTAKGITFFEFGNWLFKSVTMLSQVELLDAFDQYLLATWKVGSQVTVNCSSSARWHLLSCFMDPKQSQTWRNPFTTKIMFPLSCARVHTHTGCEKSTHKKTWSTHNFSFKTCFCMYFIQVVLSIDECWQTVAHKTLCAHRLLKK